jgi:hypothetical protein
MHGLMGNNMYAPEVDPNRHFDAMLEDLRRLDLATEGNVLFAPAIGEVLAPHAMSYAAVVGGTSGNAFVQYPRPGRSRGALVHPEFSHPESLHQTVRERFGYWPPKSSPAVELCQRVASVFVELVRPELDPEVALLWFPEPDTSQHVYGVSSRQALEGLHAADAQLGRVLDRLHALGDDPVVLALSDHGYSTIGGRVDVEQELSRAGFLTGPMGGIIYAPNGGSGLFFIRDHDEAVADRLATWLSAQEWTGALIAGRGNLDGLLQGAPAGLTGHRAPDIALTFRWNLDDRRAGSRSEVFASNGSSGQGTHGSASPAEIGATLIAAGPGIRSGIVSGVPTGQPDVLPTVLSLLGLPPDPHAVREGRVMTELFTRGPDPRDVEWRVDRASAVRGKLAQRMDLSVCGTSVYLSGAGRESDFPPGRPE